MDIESHNVDKMAKSLGIINPFRWNLIKKTSRDNARTPMQWSGDEGAGFTSGTPWLKLHPNYKTVNVEADLSDSEGVIAFFKRMNSYRKSSKTLILGSYKELAATSSVYAFEREYEGERLVSLCNFSKNRKNMPKNISGEIIISNYKDEDKKLRPYEFRLIKVK